MGGEGKGGRGAAHPGLTAHAGGEEEEKRLWTVEPYPRADGALRAAPSTSSSSLRNGRLREAESPYRSHSISWQDLLTAAWVSLFSPKEGEIPRTPQPSPLPHLGISGILPSLVP